MAVLDICVQKVNQKMTEYKKQQMPLKNII